MKRELGFGKRFGAVALAVSVALTFGPLPVAMAELLPTGSMPQAPLRGKITQSDYILGPGDILLVKDEVMDPTAEQVKILSDGTAHMKLVGQLPLAGLTLDQAQEAMNEAYAQYYVNPSMTVQIFFQRPVRVYVAGAVNHPGTYDSGKALSPEDLNASQIGAADTIKMYYRYTLTDVIVQAGGLSYNADLSDIQIIRSNQEVHHVNLWNLFAGETEQDFDLRDKDIIKVSEIPVEQLVVNKQWDELQRSNLGQSDFRVTVLGEVKAPGTYIVKSSENVLTAIAQGGGFTDVADKKKVYVLRKNSAGQVFGREINLGDKGLMRKEPIDEVGRLLPEDVVFVDASKGRTFGKGAAAYGRSAVQSVTFLLFSQIIDRFFEDE